MKQLAILGKFRMGRMNRIERFGLWAAAACGLVLLAVIVFRPDSPAPRTPPARAVPGPTVTATVTVTSKPRPRPTVTRTRTLNRYPPCPPGVPEMNGAMTAEESQRLESAGGCVWSP